MRFSRPHYHGGSPWRVARPHCCGRAPSEPCVQVVPAHGSSKPLVKIRCRRRRTSPSTRCQSIDRHARASPSGPFAPAAAGASNLSFGSRVAVTAPFTGSPDPRGRPFGPGHQAPYPASSRQAAAGRSGKGASWSCRLSARRHWLLGSSCARWGSAPPSRSAYRVPSDPIGVATLPAREIRPGWVPSILRGCGAHTAVTGNPAVAGRLTAAHPCTQVLLPPSPGLG